VAAPALALLLLGASPQEQTAPPPTSPAQSAQSETHAGPTPVFPRDIEVVTVDVVVTDKNGNPVTDLSREDFTVLDEGQPREIVSFDVVTTEAQDPIEPPAPGTEPSSPPRPRLVTNTAPESPGRTFVIFFDALNLSPQDGVAAKAAILAFLDRGLRKGDRVMLASTGGGAWWSTTMPEGRQDLIAVLEGLEGRRVYDNAFERMADYEAMRIYQYRDIMIGKRVLSRWERYGILGTRGQRENDRTLQEIAAPGNIDLFVESRAAETYLMARNRNHETFVALERVLQPLTESKDRKAVILVSGGFIYDPSERGFKKVVETARKANAAVYFVDARGLADMPGFFSAQFGAIIDERDMLAAIADTSQEAGGSVTLSRDTGGFAVASTNDLADGIVRIGRESSSYYLLAFNPTDIPRDGEFREIDVKVRRKDTTVRARRGYYAPSDTPEDTESLRKYDPQIQAALDDPGTRDQIPLRMTYYILQETSLDRVRVLLAADADISAVEFTEGADGRLTGAVDTLAVLARRENSEFFRNDLKVDLARKPGPVRSPSWYTIAREFDVPPGVYQARLVLRDTASTRVGTVTLELEVPSLDELRVTTPILTDQIQVDPGTGAPRPVVLARRTFRNDGSLYCRFDVFGAQKEERTGMPYVTSSHVLRRRGGGVVSQGGPSEIVPTSLGDLSRLMQIPLNDASPGEYELLLTVRDETNGREQLFVEPLTLVETPTG
jgi:VWFA-related protein